MTMPVMPRVMEVCLVCGIPYAHLLDACPVGHRFCSRGAPTPLGKMTVAEWVEQIEEVNLSARQNATTDHLSQLR